MDLRIKLLLPSCHQQQIGCLDILPQMCIITKEVMFLPDFSLFVCLCVSKISQKVMDGSF